MKRKLYPNVDFYSGIIYKAMGLPVDMFPVLFAIPRTSGRLAQWLELLEDPTNQLHARDRFIWGNGRVSTFQSRNERPRRAARLEPNSLTTMRRRIPGSEPEACAKVVLAHQNP